MAATTGKQSLRYRSYPHIESAAWSEPGLSPFNLVTCVAILLAVLLAILETEQSLYQAHKDFFIAAEVAFFGCFLREYILRLYVAKENPRFQGRWGSDSLCFVFWGLLNLLALMAFILPMLGGGSAFSVRLFRVPRMLRVARLGRFSSAWQMLSEATYSRRYELLMSGTVAFVLLVVSSSFLYLFEAPVQPEAFGSIPRALWWSVATLTTVGYGDVTPVTALGQLFAGITAITGIGLVAMPAGILAAAFSDAFQKRDERERSRQQ
jgi:voltage-gated potassium channel